MIGHYLLALTAEHEDRVLLETFAPYPRGQAVDQPTRCLVDVACGLWAGATVQKPSMMVTIPRWRTAPQVIVGLRYDRLCRRFGTARVNNAIRQRILENRARRVLGNAAAVGV